jgi:hypothetical protein
MQQCRPEVSHWTPQATAPAPCTPELPLPTLNFAPFCFPAKQTCNFPVLSCKSHPFSFQPAEDVLSEMYTASEARPRICPPVRQHSDLLAQLDPSVVNLAHEPFEGCVQNSQVEERLPPVAVVIDQSQPGSALVPLSPVLPDLACITTVVSAREWLLCISYLVGPCITDTP